MRYYGLKGGRLFGLFFHHKVPKIWYKGSGWAKSIISLVPVTGPRRKRSQYWPWICAPGNWGMISHLGRRLISDQKLILTKGNIAILPLVNIGFSFALACDLNGRPYPHCPGHIPMVNIETPLPAWSCHTWTRAIFTFMACLEIERVVYNVL